jgi:hypothetical protein
MTELQVRPERLRRDAADCAWISELATQPQKRELFARLAVHLRNLACEIERELSERGASRPTRLLERVRAKLTPVRVKKTRQNENLELRF